MSTDNTLSNTLSTLIATLTDLKAALDKPQGTAPDLSEYVKRDELTDTVNDEVRDAMRDSDNLGRLAQAVWDDVDMRSLADDLSSYLNIDDEVSEKVSDFFDNSFSASDYNLATEDYVDSTVDEKLDERNEDVTRRITEAVNERLDVERLAALVRVDLEAKLKQLVRDELRKILTKGLDE